MKYLLTAEVVNTWNSLSDYVVDVRLWYTIFVLKKDVKLQLTNIVDVDSSSIWRNLGFTIQSPLLLTQTIVGKAEMVLGPGRGT